MNLLGNVENGWFAQVAHGCRWIGAKVLNTLSNGAGDRLYARMDTVVNRQVEVLSEQAIQHSLSQGATPMQSLAAGSAAMERIAHPQTVEEVGRLGEIGASSGKDTVIDTVKELVTYKSPSLLGALTPVLIGAGALGGAYLLAESLTSGPRLSRS